MDFSESLRVYSSPTFCRNLTFASLQTRSYDFFCETPNPFPGQNLLSQYSEFLKNQQVYEFVATLSRFDL